MEYRSLGSTGLSVSAVGFGCSSYWAKPHFSERLAIALVAEAVANGITFFDTGPSYSEGNAERRLGKALRLSGASHVVLATKVGTMEVRRGKRLRKDFGSSAVWQSVRTSLRRLGREFLPLVHLHAPSLDDLNEELFDTLQDIKDRGLVRHFGVYSRSPTVIRAALAVPVFEIIMSDFNILRQDMLPLIEEIVSAENGFIAATPLAQTLFDDRILRPRNCRDIWYLLRALARHRGSLKRARAFRFLTGLSDMTGAQAALAFVLSHKCVSTAVFGTTQQDHLTANLSAVDLSLPRDLLDRITANGMQAGVMS